MTIIWTSPQTAKLPQLHAVRFGQHGAIRGAQGHGPGGKVISLSDSEGMLYAESGLTEAQWSALLELRRGREWPGNVAERHRLLWTAGEVDSKLQSIHQACVHYGEENGQVNYGKGANIAGFVKVADATLAQGIV